MTKKNDPELLLALLDTYTSGVTSSLQTVAEMNGCSFRSLYGWMLDPEIIVPEFMGKTDVPFGEAMKQARKVSLALVVSKSLEERVNNGIRVQVWHHGQPSFRDDEKAILIEDLDLREMLFGYRDGKERDADGNRIIMTKIEPPPAQLVEFFSRGAMPQIYGNKSEVTMKGAVQLGVTVVAPAIRRPIPPEALPFASAADLEGVTETTLIEGAYEPDKGLDDLLGLEVTDTEPGLPSSETASPDEPAAAPEPPPPEPVVIREQPYMPPGQWRAEYDALMARANFPKKTNRG